MKKSILFLLSIFAFIFNTKAQDGLENILFADTSDANTLTTAYLRPAAEGFIYGMSSGWYHTAKVHKTLGFDISIGGNFSFSGGDQKIFDVNTLNLSNQITQKPASSPTVLGSSSAAINGFEVTIPANTELTINGGVHPELKRNFTLPDGLGSDLPLNGVPTPAIQVSLGLPGQFEATLRLVPEIGGNETKSKLFGLGVKKEITDWFGPLGKTPLHISLMGAFTNMTITNLIEDPDGNEVNITNGVVELKLNSYTVQALASLNFPFLNIYGGFGYVSGSSALSVAGTYELEYSSGSENFTKRLIDPLNLDFDASGFTTTLGARLSLGFFKVYGSYSLQEYNTANLGIAFSLR
jgi:hypothetical protein